MKRKVNRVGTNTLTVSLPSKWVKKRDLQPGDELDVNEFNDGLLIGTTLKKTNSKHIELDISEYTYFSLARVLEVIYRGAYSSIVLFHNKPTIYYAKQDTYLNLVVTIKKLVERNIGSEIISQTANRTEIGCLGGVDSLDIKKIERRIQYLFKDILSQLVEAMSGDYNLFHERVYTHHDLIARFINYYLRVVNKTDISSLEKQYASTLYVYLDKLADKMRHVSERIQKYGVTPRVKKLIKDVFDFFMDQFLILQKNKISTEFNNRRYDLVKRVLSTKYTEKEFQVVSELKPFLDVLSIFVECQFARKILKTKEVE